MEYNPFSNPFSLKGKTILVTGASSGIGRGISIACSNMGGNIILGGRSESRLMETLNMMECGNNSIAMADLTDMKVMSEMVSSLPKLDGVVHCAGVGLMLLCKQLTEKDLDDVMNANFKAPVMLQTEILKQKKLNKGASVVFISSMGAESPKIGNAIYSASKGAVLSYSYCLAKELAPRQIRVNCIQPAMVWTELIFKGGLTEEDLKLDEERYPLKRYGKPEDIANLAVYLLSDASSWMTGSSVKITGGVR